MSVNDAFVMAEWGKSQGAAGKVSCMVDIHCFMWNVCIDAFGGNS